MGQRSLDRREFIRREKVEKLLRAEEVRPADRRAADREDEARVRPDPQLGKLIDPRREQLTRDVGTDALADGKLDLAAAREVE